MASIYQVKNLKQRELAFWNEYIETLPRARRPRRPFVSASFAGNPKCTDSLLRLYLDGKKTAGSSLVQDFISSGDPLPRVGNYWILLDSKSRPRCLLRTVRTGINAFKRVPKRIARGRRGRLVPGLLEASSSKILFPVLEEVGNRITG